MKKSQLIRIHEYARLARLPDAEYRELLHRSTGKRSSKFFEERDFERAMAAMEAALWYRADEGIVPPPPPNVSRDYWRKKLPPRGACNTRLKWKIENLWHALCPLLPPQERNETYLAHIIGRATNLDPAAFLESARLAWHKLPNQAAHLAINALKDRLHYALKTAASPALSSESESAP